MSIYIIINARKYTFSLGKLIYPLQSWPKKMYNVRSKYVDGFSYVWSWICITDRPCSLHLSIHAFHHGSKNCYSYSEKHKVYFQFQILRMETDHIRMKSDSDNTFYHLFTRIRIQIQMFSNTNTKRISPIRKHIHIFIRFGKTTFTNFLHW
jgi:hypothetical protein